MMSDKDGPRSNIGPKKRSCLRCGKLFPSLSIGNRICPKCHKKNRGLSKIDISGPIKPVGEDIAELTDE